MRNWRTGIFLGGDRRDRTVLYPERCVVLQAAHPGSRERIEWASIVADVRSEPFFRRETSPQPLRLDSEADERSR